MKFCLLLCACISRFKCVVSLVLFGKDLIEIFVAQYFTSAVGRLFMMPFLKSPCAALPVMSFVWAPFQ